MLSSHEASVKNITSREVHPATEESRPAHDGSKKEPRPLLTGPRPALGSEAPKRKSQGRLETPALSWPALTGLGLTYGYIWLSGIVTFVRLERTTLSPAGTVTFQLSPRPLSISVSPGELMSVFSKGSRAVSLFQSTL